MNKKFLPWILALCFIGGIAFSMTIGFTNPEKWFGKDEQNGSTLVNPQKVATPADLSLAFEAVAEKATPTVVEVRTTVKQERQQIPDIFKDFFRQLPNQPNQEEESPEEYGAGLGSGVIIREDGYIVTNNHVIAGATDIEVVLSDGQKFSAKLVGTDESNDIAVVKIDKSGLPAVSFGQASDVKVGQWVLAIGSPLDASLSSTVTAGIISAIGRAVEMPSAEGSRRGFVKNYIQTDAAINPGNSGGALLNIYGQLVGINTAIYSRTGGYQGIGFAVPVDIVKNVTDQIISTGKVRKGFLGVQFGPVSESLAQAMNLPRGAAMVASVNPNSPADKAGLQKDDIILAVNGQKLRTSNQLSVYIGNLMPGSTVNLLINRDEQEKTISVTLGERPTDFGAATPDAEQSEEASELGGNAANQRKEFADLGFTVQNLSAALRQKYNLKDDVSGVVVTAVNPSKPAVRDASLFEGMVITDISASRRSSDDSKVRNVSDVERKINGFSDGQSFYIRGVSANGNSFLTAMQK